MTAVVQLETFRPAPREDVPTPTDLLALARGRSADDRQRLLLGITALCDAAPPGAEASPVLTEIFMILAGQAERDIRKALSECLAGAEWAPAALINMLALDEIEIARPVIAASPLLQDHDLIHILVEATIEHQIAVARRPNLGSAVADAIIARGDPSCVTALASNRTARISEAGVGRLVEQSRRIAALRAPLTRHPGLTEVLAEQLYQWVGQALREAIGDRFRTDDGAIAAAIDRSIAVVRAVEEPVEPTPAAREETERRLVAKLHAAGQLRAGFLIRAIREKRLSLFEHALAMLGNFTITQVRGAIHYSTSDALLLACTAVNIDKAVFPAVLEEIRELSGGWPHDAGGSYWAKQNLSPRDAAREFRSLMREAGC